MVDRKVWCVRGGTKDWLGHDLFLANKVVALDEPFLPDLSQIPPAREMLNEWPKLPLPNIQQIRTRRMYGEIYEAVKKMYHPGDPPMGKAALGLKVGHLLRLANVANQGDLVIYPPKGKENDTVYIGEIVSEYFYVDCCFQHRRRVNWRKFSKGRLPDKFGPVLGFTSFTEVRNEEQARKIKNKFRTQPMPF